MEKDTPLTRKIIIAIIAATAWFALALQLKISMGTTSQTGFSTIKTVTNFFSYFTILSNLLAGISLTVTLLTPASRVGSFFSKIPVQSAIAVYIFIVGLVYNLVLRNIWEPEGWQLVADNLLHVVVPVLYVLYWLFFTPKNILRWTNILPWLIFPAVYLIYSLIRGLVTSWYPYPFIHAGNLGYGKVTINSLFVLIAIVAVSVGAIAFNKLTKKISSH